MGPIRTSDRPLRIAYTHSLPHSPLGRANTGMTSEDLEAKPKVIVWSIHGVREPTHGRGAQAAPRGRKAKLRSQHSAANPATPVKTEGHTSSAKAQPLLVANEPHGLNR